MSYINIQSYSSPYGELLLGSFDNKLCLCDWKNRKQREQIDKRLQSKLNANFRLQDDDILKRAKQQLEQYFSNKRQAFDIPLLLVGTDFQQQVWNKLQQIPFGKTASYAELANAVGNSKAIRAVANSNAANAISLFIPCHRIIGSNGTLTGYAGGLETKRALLTLEKSQ